MVLHTNTHTQAFIKHLDVPVSMNALTDMWPVSIGTSLTEHNTHLSRHSSAHTVYRYHGSLCLQHVSQRLTAVQIEPSITVS